MSWLVLAVAPSANVENFLFIFTKVSNEPQLFVNSNLVFIQISLNHWKGR